MKMPEQGKKKPAAIQDPDPTGETDEEQSGDEEEEEEDTEEKEDDIGTAGGGEGAEEVVERGKDGDGDRIDGSSRKPGNNQGQKPGKPNHNNAPKPGKKPGKHKPGKKPHKWSHAKQDAMRKEFMLLDLDNSGFVDAKDLSRVTGGFIPETFFAEAIHMIDTNKDGKISFDEYKTVRSLAKMLKHSSGHGGHRGVDNGDGNGNDRDNNTDNNHKE